jgi:imidazolonepropionase-like amidohydrolase
MEMIGKRIHRKLGVWLLALAGLAPVAALTSLACGGGGAPEPGVVSAAPYSPDGGTLAVRAGRLIDGVSDSPLENVTVLIEQGRIQALGPDVEIPREVPVLDLSEYTVLPGLIDMHTHVCEESGETADLSVYHRRTVAEAVEHGVRNASTTLLAGFTSVRDVGTYVAWADRELRDRIDRGEAIGPRMQVAGYYLTISGGGGDLLTPGAVEKTIPELVRMGVSRGADQFRRKAQAAVDGGAGALKVIASGAVLAHGGIPDQPEMTPEEIRAVAEVAHAAGRKLAAHAHGARSVKEAILAGADTIEHASLIDEEGIRLAKERGVALAMDVYNGDYIDTEGRRQKWPEEFLRKNLETTEAQRQAFSKAVAVGAPIVFATDAGVYPHGRNAVQFPIMVQRGMTPMQAIQAATSVAARFLGWEDRVGSLQPGRFGDLIAVRGDPLADISALQDVQAVVKGGLVFKRPERAER